jgi:ATPase subunit of ABC transporter with duplicated ATPase domains
MSLLLRVTNASITAPGGRILFEGLTIQLSRGERVALVGRNGVGKSTLLAQIAEREGPRAWFVSQALRGDKSPGELRREALTAASRAAPDVLLLDEPTSDLDDDALAWLRAWLVRFTGCAIVASHDRRLLTDFRDFFIASEAGSRAFTGTLDALDAALDYEHDRAEARYMASLRDLAAVEERVLDAARRRGRKKRYGRCRELDRATPRARLNAKRSQAQVNHGRDAKMREKRLDAARGLSLAMRRALDPSLALELPVPAVSAEATPAVVLSGACVASLFGPLDLRVARERVGIVGANGAGKTTLLDVMLGHRLPDRGSAARDLTRIGAIGQGATDYVLEESLLELLATPDATQTLEDSVTLVAAHKFPLALAERPLASLSPGERARAALIVLFRRAPPPDVLVLDEPTYSLDLVGQRAMTKALTAYRGGFVVASHDREFLTAIGVERWIDLGRDRGRSAR